MPPLENTPGEQDQNNADQQNQTQGTDPGSTGETNTGDTPTQVETPPPADPPQDNPPPTEQTPEELALEQRTDARSKQLLDLNFEYLASTDGNDIAHIPDTDFSVDADFVKTADDEAWDRFIESVTTAQEKEPEAEPFVPFDYTGMVRLSDINGDAIDVKKANKLVKASGVYDKYKGDMLDEIKSGRFSPPYAEMMRKMITADHQGSAYSGGL